MANLHKSHFIRKKHDKKNDIVIIVHKHLTFCTRRHRYTKNPTITATSDHTSPAKAARFTRNNTNKKSRLSKHISLFFTKSISTRYRTYLNTGYTIVFIASLVGTVSALIVGKTGEK